MLEDVGVIVVKCVVCSVAYCAVDVGDVGSQVLEHGFPRHASSSFNRPIHMCPRGCYVLVNGAAPWALLRYD